MYFMKFKTHINVISCVKVQWKNPYEVVTFFFLKLNLNITKLINYWIL